ncbi:MAG: DUF5606 domain-containing protein [Bacteroidaceae bacterium]|nr:DUF5606 domain-containing protein [Bacteroidaceae bacterium]
MQDTILAITGKPGLFKLVSHGRGSLIVECIDDSKKRFTVGVRDRVTSLGDISMYTDDEDVALMEVLQAAYDKYEGKPIDIALKTADNKQLAEIMGEVLPNYDRDRVYPSDMKKLIQWYNLLVKNGYQQFVTPEETEEAVAE